MNAKEQELQSALKNALCGYKNFYLKDQPIIATLKRDSIQLINCHLSFSGIDDSCLIDCIGVTCDANGMFAITHPLVDEGLFPQEALFDVFHIEFKVEYRKEAFKVDIANNTLAIRYVGRP